MSIENGLLSKRHFNICWIKGDFYLVLGSQLFGAILFLATPPPIHF